jgi:hypothetical protein
VVGVAVELATGLTVGLGEVVGLEVTVGLADVELSGDTVGLAVVVGLADAVGTAPFEETGPGAGADPAEGVMAGAVAAGPPSAIPARPDPTCATACTASGTVHFSPGWMGR